YILCLSAHALHKKEQHTLLRRARQLNTGHIFFDHDYCTCVRSYCHVGHQILAFKKGKILAIALGTYDLGMSLHGAIRLVLTPRPDHNWGSFGSCEVCF
ncbi:hypothetical protein, partial [Pseudomonas viridiflava]|uniref:hypothetical protein n=1 Tax=Pseudomonas viridiflava TaxID=33069 RepID=UPI0019D18CA5